MATELRSLLDTLGHTNVDLAQALSDFAGVENLEERMVPDRIDPVVLDHLRDLVARRGGTS